MGFIIILLGIIFLVLLITPSTEDKKKLAKEIKMLIHCDRHEWINKSNQIDDGYYMVCKKCRYLPDSDDYEPNWKG